MESAKPDAEGGRANSNTVQPNGRLIRQLRLERELSPEGVVREIKRRSLQSMSARTFKRIEGGERAYRSTVSVLATFFDRDFGDLVLSEDTDQMLATYAMNLTDEVYNNLPRELFRKRHYDDICIAPLVQAINEIGDKEPVQDVSHLVSTSRAVILGEPGAGKTTALRKLTLELLRESPMTRIPVYLSLADCGDCCEKQLTTDFPDYIDYRLAVLGAPPMDVIASVPGTVPVLLLDGWDELPREDLRDGVRRYLATHQWTCILTSRWFEQNTLPPAERYALCPLTPDRVDEFLRLRMNDSDKRNALLQWIQRDVGVRSMARNPLNLSLMTVIAADAATQYVDAPHRTQLCALAFDAILREHHRAHRHSATGIAALHEHETVLQSLAYELLASGRGRSFSDRDVVLAAERVLGRVSEHLSDLLAGRFGVLRRRGLGRLEFFHSWYQEFLAARQMIENTERTWTEFANPRMSSCLPFVVGLMRESGENPCVLLTEVPIHNLFDYCAALAEARLDQHDLLTCIQRVISHGRGCCPNIPVRIELSRALVVAGPQILGCLRTIAKDDGLSGYARRAAIESLALLAGDDGLFDELLLDLLPKVTADVAWHTLEHVGRRRLAAAEDWLLKYAAGDDPISAGDAIWAMRQLDKDDVHDVPERVSDGLVSCLASPDGHTQGHALRTIGRLGMRGAIGKLRHYLADERSPYRWIVPQAAALIGGCEASALLQFSLEDADVRVVGMALRGIGQLDDADVSGVVRKRLEALTGRASDATVLGQPLSTIASDTLRKLRRKGREASLARVFVCRHCATEWNIEGRLQGKKNLELHATGQTQARVVANSLRRLHIDRIYSSNSLRAYQTAEVYQQAIKVPLHSSPGLRELDHGAWEKRTLDDLRSDDSSGFLEWTDDPASVSIPGSDESATSGQQRMIETIERIARSHAGETVLVVSHKHVLALLACAVHNVPMRMFASMIDEGVAPVLLPEPAMLEMCR